MAGVVIFWSLLGSSCLLWVAVDCREFLEESHRGYVEAM